MLAKKALKASTRAPYVRGYMRGTGMFQYMLHIVWFKSVEMLTYSVMC